MLYLSQFQGEICGPAKSFTNVSARLSDDGKILHILVQYVEEKSKVEDLDPSIFSPSNGDSAGPGSSNFLNIVEWIEFDCGNLNQAKKTETETQTQNAVSSKFERLRRYAFLGEIEYLELVQSGILCFGEDKSFQLLYDSEGYFLMLANKYHTSEMADFMLLLWQIRNNRKRSEGTYSLKDFLSKICRFKDVEFWQMAKFAIITI